MAKRKHRPTEAQKKRYHALIRKSYTRLRNVLKKHDPGFLSKNGG